MGGASIPWTITGSVLTNETSGRLYPGRHRVVASGAVTRLSNGMFSHPRVDTLVQPLAPSAARTSRRLWRRRCS